MKRPPDLVRKPLHGQIAEHLQRMILDGDFPSGTALPGERDLAEQFGVSRNSLRQATAYLEAMGLLESHHGRGVFVTDRSDDAVIERFADVVLDPRRSIVHVTEARLGSEPFTARRAAERRTSDDLVELEKFVVAHRDDEPAVVPGNFHQRVARSANNPVLVGILRALTIGPGGVAGLLDFEPDVRQVWDEAHLHIFESIRDADPAAAESAMRTHLEHVVDVAQRFSAGL